MQSSILFRSEIFPEEDWPVYCTSTTWRRTIWAPIDLILLGRCLLRRCFHRPRRLSLCWRSSSLDQWKSALVRKNEQLTPPSLGNCFVNDDVSKSLEVLESIGESLSPIAFQITAIDKETIYIVEGALAPVANSVLGLETVL